MNAIQKLLSGLKNVFQKCVTELHAKVNADTLLDFAIHCSQNETRSRKSTPVKTACVHSAVLHGRLMQ
jgi:hypothetical protein